MLRRPAAVLSLLLVVLAVPSAASARGKCDVKNSRQILIGRDLRVYGKDGTAYACVRATGQKTKLDGAAPRADLFRIARHYVAWTSGTDDPSDPAHSQVNELLLPDRTVPDSRPYRTGGTVGGLALLSDGAVAWAATPTDSSSVAYVEGFDRDNHSPDTFSSDEKSVKPSSLHVVSGKTIGWSYTDGSTDSVELY